MPLEHSRSDAARERNIEREIGAGKPPQQAVAIGYAEQRRAGGEPRDHALDKASATRTRSKTARGGRRGPDRCG